MKYRIWISLYYDSSEDNYEDVEDLIEDIEKDNWKFNSMYLLSSNPEKFKLLFYKTKINENL